MMIEIGRLAATHHTTASGNVAHRHNFYYQPLDQVFTINPVDQWRNPPRHYQDKKTFATWSGDQSRPCPLPAQISTDSKHCLE
jgi:hypothetical protein